MKRQIALLILSLFIAVVLMIFQRLTGPTYPISGKAQLGAETIRFQLLRSHAGAADHTITVPTTNDKITGCVKWKRYKTDEPWQTVPLQRPTIGNTASLIATLPHQPPAGKLVYLVELTDGTNTVSLTGQQPVVIRFRGEVPPAILIPHILFMVLAMFLGARAALEACVNGQKIYWYACVTTASLVVGGMLLGPVVQYYAFGQFWTGFPFGYDLTDNKTLLSLVVWVLALWRGRQGHLRAWIIAAFVSLFVIYAIPHSVMGSELDYSKLPK